MTHAALIPEERRSFDLSELVLLPFALMLALFRCFFGEKLQWARRQRRSRPMPTNWRQHYAELRFAEWSVVELTRTGLARLLAGKPLDLEGIETTDPPEDWICPMPTSAFAMHRRIEAVLAFNADPEGRIRSLARRAVRRTAAVAVVASTDPPPVAPATAAAVVAAPAIAPRIRAPPEPGELLEAIGRGGRFLRIFQQISGIRHRHWKRFQPASNAGPSQPRPRAVHARDRGRAPMRPWRGTLPGFHRAAAARCA
jgi:hypothetical protein